MAREMAEDFPGFAPSAIAAMEAHGWPGNVRELRNFAQRITYRAISEHQTDPVQFDPAALDPFDFALASGSRSRRDLRLHLQARLRQPPAASAPPPPVLDISVRRSDPPVRNQLDRFTALVSASGPSRQSRRRTRAQLSPIPRPLKKARIWQRRRQTSATAAQNPNPQHVILRCVNTHFRRLSGHSLMI